MAFWKKREQPQRDPTEGPDLEGRLHQAWYDDWCGWTEEAHQGLRYVAIVVSAQHYRRYDDKQGERGRE